jgi:hypothetical protein
MIDSLEPLPLAPLVTNAPGDQCARASVGASSSSSAPAAIAAGIPIAASWPDADFNHTGGEPTPDQWRRHWARCVDEASAANVTLMFAQEGERQMGALVEAGACLGAGKTLYLVSPHDWSFRHHPRVRCFGSLEQAVAAVVAGA